VKKVGGTSSTLSNLENLYAAFAKQQKEKAKLSEEKAALKESSKRASETATTKSPASSTPLARDQLVRQAAMDLQITEGTDEALRESRRSWLDSGVFSDTLDEKVQGKDWVQALDRRRPRTEGDQDATLTELGRLYNDRPTPTMRTAREELANRTAWSVAEIEETEELKEIAAGRLDPTSPQALEAKRRAQPIVPRSESEATSIEQSLVAKHRAAVEQVAYIEKDLDLSSSVPGMAPLTHSQNPYLYNEAYALGLTSSELQWLQTRPHWKSLVTAKRTNIALQQRNMKEDRELVDDLFLRVVNTLSEGPQTDSWIHPDDLKAQQRALEARDRLQQKMTEIYKHYPGQWAAMLHKYLPNPLAEKAAEHVFNREFWSPSNPWLLAAFTKSVITEAELLNKSHVSNPLETEIHQRLVDQGLAREDDKTDEMDGGAMGETDGLTPEEKHEAMAQQERAMANYGCLFCSNHRHVYPLDPMNVPLLARHMTTSGQILPRQATGLCKRHQAKMSKTIKQARHLNLFTHKKSEYRINNVFKPAEEWGTPDLDVPLYVDPLIARRYAKDVDMESWIDRMGGAEEDEHLFDIPKDAEGDEELLDTIQTWKSYAVDDADENLDDLNGPTTDPTMMTDIEELAGALSQDDRMMEGTDLPSEESMKAAFTRPQTTVADAVAKSKTYEKHKRERQTISSVSFDQDTDEIGDSMVKAALSGKGGKRGARSTYARKDRDTL
jgi:ribosomal protein S18